MKSELISVYNIVEGYSDDFYQEIIDLVETILLEEGLDNEEISVILTDEEEITRLNSEYAGVEGNTDVLSFDFNEEELKYVEGEIYINTTIAELQAQQRSISEEEEILNLVAHGVLHLCKYDHQTEGEYLEMLKRGSRYVSRVLLRNQFGH